MSLFSNIVSPNADIAALLAQQNLANRSGGGGSYSGAGIEDTLNLYAGQQGLAEQAMNRAEPRERRNALFQMAMQKDLARDKMALDREALEHAANLEEQAILKSKILELRLASAGQAEKQQIADQLAEVEKQRADLADRRNSATATFAKKNSGAQEQLIGRINEVTRTRELLNTRMTQFRSSFDTMGEGADRRLGALDNTLSMWMSNPAKAGAQLRGAFSTISPPLEGDTVPESQLTDQEKQIRAAMANLPQGEEAANSTIRGLRVSDRGEGGSFQFGGARVLEGMVNWVTGDPVADAAIAEAYGNNPAVLDAAARWGNGKGLISLIPGKDKGALGSAMDPSRDRSASQFAVNIMADSIVSAMSALGTGFNRDAALKSATALLQELHNHSRNGTTDPTKATAAIMPLIKQFAIDAYGSDQNAGEAVAMLKHSLSEMAKREGSFARKAMETPGSIGVDAVKNAAMAYSMGLAGSMKHVLSASSKGQVMDDDAYNFVLGMMEKAKEGDAGYRLAGIQEVPEFVQVLGPQGVAALRAGKAASKELVETEELLKREEVDIERKKALGTKKIPGQQGARRSAELAVLQELLKRPQAGR